MRHPEIKANNFFMQQVGSGALERVDSLSLDRQDSLLGKRQSQLNLEEELMRIQVENQRQNELLKSESCFSRIKRIKRAHEELHKKCFD